MTDRSRDAILHLHNKGFRVQPDGTVLKGDGSLCKLGQELHGGYPLICTRVRRHPTYGNWILRVAVHRLAAYQLFGDRVFDPTLQVCHCDGNPKNNSHANLRLDTPTGNRLDIPPLERQRLARKAGRANTHITDEVAAEIRAANLTLREIMERYGMSKTCASYLRAGKTFKSS